MKAKLDPPRPEDLDPIETASRDELSSLQLERMRDSIDRAYHNVPLYRRKFDQAGVSPSDLTGLEDIARFPFATKSDLRDSYPFEMFAVPMSDIVRLHASSGTTGHPTVVGYTTVDIEVWADLMARSIRAAGGRREHRVHISYGYGLFTGGLGAHYGAERLGATVIPVSGGLTERQVRLIRDFEPDLIMVTPSYVLNIADEFERQGLDPATSSLRVGMFGAEPWTEAMRHEIEARLALDALDIYGLSEVLGPGVAQECIETKDGLTLWEDHFYPEIIDPENGAVLPDGEPGELVLTTLTKEALPMIRYRTGDLTTLLPGTARTMRRIKKVTGRSDDMLIIRGVNVFPSQIEELVLAQPELAPFYMLEIHREGRLDRLDVRVEAKTELSAMDTSEKAKVAETLTRHIKSATGLGAQVVFAEPGGIERSQGKARRVIDHRPKA